MLPLRQIAKVIIPDSMRGPAKHTFDSVARPVSMRLYRGRSRYCPICERHSRAFQPFGLKPRSVRPDARCPVCNSLERHRLMWLFLHARTDLFRGDHRRLLHIAPERVLADRFAAFPWIEYVSGDLDPTRAMMRIDVTNIDLPDDYFDAVICSHVLEHVPDDRQAMRELHRVLRPGGWAILQVPIGAAVTVEDSDVRSPHHRRLEFGLLHHVRVYGQDYFDRLREAGFLVTIDEFASTLPEEQLKLVRVPRHERVFFCRKP